MSVSNVNIPISQSLARTRDQVVKDMMTVIRHNAKQLCPEHIKDTALRSVGGLLVATKPLT